MGDEKVIRFLSGLTCIKFQFLTLLSSFICDIFIICYLLFIIILSLLLFLIYYYFYFLFYFFIYFYFIFYYLSIIVISSVFR